MPGKEYGLKKTKKYKELKNNSTNFIDGKRGIDTVKIAETTEIKSCFPARN